MATNAELKIMQKNTLFDLLKLKRDNEKKGHKVAGLNDLIVKTRASMEQEDVAWVEKTIEELED